MHPRFYAPDARQIGQLVTLPQDEATHATRVLRLQIGDRVGVFDGHGREFVGVIARASKSEVGVSLEHPHDAAPERRMAVTLAQAVLKGDKMDDVVRDAVMMGVTAIVPLVSARSEVSLATLQRAKRRERWERIAIVSAKQCGRAVVPVIEDACDLDALCGRLASGSAGAGFMFVEPGAAPAVSAPQPLPSPPALATVIIGPEGGWAGGEVEKAAPAVSAITLRGPTLRADAMPIVALAVLFARWGEL